MSKAKYNPKIKSVLDSLLLNTPGVTGGKVFGYPAYYIGKKMFACIYGDGVGIKVPEDIAREMVKNEGIIFFQPLGRSKMKQWIQINRLDPDDYYREMDVFKTSIDYVLRSSK